LHHKLNSIYIDQDSQYIQLFVGDKGYTTKKLIITSMSHFYVENPRYANPVAQPHYFNHLYMLVEEASLPRFSYLAGIAPGMSRVMNLTPFLQMPQENQQLIVVQTHRASDFEKAQQFLEAFIAHGYLTQDAKILALDQYVYDQSYSNTSPISLLGGSMIEILDTSNFPGLNRYIDKWKTTISPLQERDRCESVP